MFFLLPFCLLASTASAVKYYGDVPDTVMHTNMHTVAQPADDTFLLNSLFVSHDLASVNGSDFLAESGILDTTLVALIMDIHASNDSYSGVTSRAPADQLKCDASPVVDKISPKNQKHICNAVKSLVGGGVAAVSALIDNTVCSEQSTGHPVKCHTIVAFIGTAGVTMSTSEVGDYCSEYLSQNDKKCGSRGIHGDSGDKRVRSTVANTQNDATSCSGLRGKCTEIGI